MWASSCARMASIEDWELESVVGNRMAGRRIPIATGTSMWSEVNSCVFRNFGAAPASRSVKVARTCWGGVVELNRKRRAAIIPMPSHAMTQQAPAICAEASVAGQESSQVATGCWTDELWDCCD